MKQVLVILLFMFLSKIALTQNSMVGDGFGGRLWYKPYNYTVGSYSAYTICGDEKQLYGWGANGFGQLGDSSFTSTDKPIKVKNMTNVKYYSTGYVMGAIKEDSTGWVWGKPTAGMMDYSVTIPTKVIDDVMFVDAGMFNCAFVKKDGTVWSVGSSNSAEFGNGQHITQFSLIPQQMLNVSTAVRTAQGGFSTTVLLKDGTVLVAGLYNATTYTTPTTINFNAFIVDIKANTNANLALDSSGNVWFWNANTVPYQLSGIKNVVAISGCNDGDHFFLLDDNHDCYALGENTAGQCGIPGIFQMAIPTKVASNVNDIMAGEVFSYIIKTDGQLYATGHSNGGSIWLDLPNEPRDVFTPINPTIPSINLCGASNNGEFGNITIPIPEVDTPIIFFPNAFSPNGDFKNDIFKAICMDETKLEKFDLKIFNRNGTLLFHTTSIDKGWEGKNTEISTYFFYCRYKQYHKRFQEVKGDVTVVK